MDKNNQIMNKKKINDSKDGSYLFKNCHRRDKSLIKEVTFYSMFLRKTTFILALVMIVWIACTAVVTFLDPNSNKMILLFEAIAVLAIFAMQIFVYLKTVKKACEQEKSSGNDRIYTLFIYDESIIFTETEGGLYQTRFSDIRTVEQTKNCVLFFTFSRKMYIIDKRGFERGSYKELLEFLNTKGFNLKIKKRFP